MGRIAKRIIYLACQRIIGRKNILFRLLTIQDKEAYADLVHDAYQADGELGIDFAAVTLAKEEIAKSLNENPTYGLFIDGKLVSAITLRMPWGPKPGPYGLPHLGWVSTRPEEKKKGYSKRLFHLLEEQILKEQWKVPAVTLGTASEHPWLISMYESWGFHVVERKRLSHNKHETTYLRKDYKKE